MKKISHVYSKLPLGINQTIITTFGNYLSAFISAIAIIVISRDLGPTLFGEFSGAFSITMIVSRINDFGLTIATQKYASQSKIKPEVKTIIQYGYHLKIIISLILLVILLPFSPYITRTLNFSSNLLVPISLILGISLTYYDQLVAALLSMHSFTKAAVVNLTQALFKLVGTSIILVSTNSKLVPAVFVFSFAPAVPVLLKRFYEPTWYKNINSKNVLNTDLKNRIHSLAIHSALLVFAVGVMDYIGVLFVKSYVDSYQAGLLGGISRIALLFSLIAVSLGQVLNSRVARYKLKSDVSTFIKKAMYIVLGVFLLYFLVLPLLPLIIIVTIGPDYLEARVPLAISLASIFFYIASVPFNSLFYSFEKNSYFSLAGVIQLVSIVIGNYLLVPNYGIYGSTTAQLVSRGLLFAFAMIFSLIVYKQKYKS